MEEIEDPYSSRPRHICQKTRIGCFFSWRRISPETSGSPTPKTTPNSSSQIYPLVYFEWSLCHSPTSIHSIRWSRSRFPTFSHNAFDSGYNSPIRTFNTTEDW